MKIRFENFVAKAGYPAIRIYSPYNESFIKGASKIQGRFNKIEKGWEFPAEEWKLINLLIQSAYGIGQEIIPERVRVEVTFLERIVSNQDIYLLDSLIVSAMDHELAKQMASNIGWLEGDLGSFYDKDENEFIAFIEDGAVISINDLDINDFSELQKDSRISAVRVRSL